MSARPTSLLASLLASLLVLAGAATACAPHNPIGPLEEALTLDDDEDLLVGFRERTKEKDERRPPAEVPMQLVELEPLPVHNYLATFSVRPTLPTLVHIRGVRRDGTLRLAHAFKQVLRDDEWSGWGGRVGVAGVKGETLMPPETYRVQAILHSGADVETVRVKTQDGLTSAPIHLRWEEARAAGEFDRAADAAAKKLAEDLRERGFAGSEMESDDPLRALERALERELRRHKLPCSPDAADEVEHVTALTQYRLTEALRVNTTNSCRGDQRVLSIWIDPDETAATLRGEPLSITRERGRLIIEARGFVTLMFSHSRRGARLPHPDDDAAAALGRGLERVVDDVMLGRA